MNIKEKVEELVKKLTSDKTLMDKFQKNPGKTVEELLGVDIPEEQVNQVVSGVKAKIKLDDAAGALGSIGKILGK